MKFTKILPGALALAALGISSTGFAGGFQLFEASVSSLGNAFAGTGAVAQDASTEFYNPAGMTLIKHPQIVVAGTALQLNIKTHVTSAENTTKLIAISPPFKLDISAPVTGNSTSHPGGWNAIPAFHFVYPWHKIALGFGVTAPFGLETDYGANSMARFLATESQLKVINVGPNIAFQVTPKLSVGAGFDLQYLDANLDQDVSIIPKATPLPLPPPFDITIPKVDGIFKTHGDDLGYGWNVGVLYQFTSDTRVGLAYRSAVTHRLKGTGTLEIPENSDIEELTSTFGDVKSSITLPDYADLSLYHAFNPKWAMMAGVDYTDWSEMQDLSLHFTGPIGKSVKNITVPLSFRNTWRLSLGANYKPNNHWIFRTGVAYDQSPVRGASTRTFRLPDSNRYWIAVGGGYRFNNAVSIDAGYSHLFDENGSIDRTQVNTADYNFDIIDVQTVMIAHALANVTSNVNEFGLQLNWNLDSNQAS